jgi:hypothetical protein
MTVLENSIRIDAPPEKVWSVLASLDVLDHSRRLGDRGAPADGKARASKR